MEFLTLSIFLICGAILVYAVKIQLNKKADHKIQLQKNKEDKYHSLLVFMACAMDIHKKEYFTVNELLPYTSSEEYMNKLKEYYYHSTLYSTDEVLIALKIFIQNPTQDAYSRVAYEMRKEVRQKHTRLSLQDIAIDG